MPMLLRAAVRRPAPRSSHAPPAACRTAKSGSPSASRDRSSSCARRSTASRTSQFSAIAASTANSTARLFSTGSAPGSPRHVGQICVFGADAEPCQAAAEGLGRGQQLDMHLQPDHRFVLRQRCRAERVAVAVISPAYPASFLSGLAYPDECIVLSPGTAGADSPLASCPKMARPPSNLPQNVRGGYRFVLILAVRR